MTVKGIKESFKGNQVREPILWNHRKRISLKCANLPSLKLIGEVSTSKQNKEILSL
jgi:hypothetical protein